MVVDRPHELPATYDPGFSVSEEMACSRNLLQSGDNSLREFHPKHDYFTPATFTLIQIAHVSLQQHRIVFRKNDKLSVSGDTVQNLRMLKGILHELIK